MAIVESCFGSLAAGEAFATAAFEHPILRIKIDGEEFPPSKEDLIAFQVVAGIVSAPDLVVPKEDDAPGPLIEISPASIARFTTTYATLIDKKRSVAPNYEHFKQPLNNLVLAGVVTEETLRPQLTRLINTRSGSLTFARTRLVAQAVGELREAADYNNSARHCYHMAKLALGDIWA